MGTDMHVAIEIRRPEYHYPFETVKPTWKYITQWTVDRWYDLFGAFDVRTSWSNSLSPRIATDMSSWLKREQKDFRYGFYEITPDYLKEKVLGWSPPANEWGDIEDYERPTIKKEWFFDMYVSKESYDDYYIDNVYYVIYKAMIKKYGKNNVRLVVFFDS